MVAEIEGTHKIGDQSLYTKTWKPDGLAKAKLIFVHGFSDHVDRYSELFQNLASRGIEVYGFDQRGWGRSVYKPSEKGNTGPTETVLSDLVSVINTQLPSSVPVFILGHSMGGAIVLTLASDPKYQELIPKFRGWMVEAPLIWFPKEAEPSSLKVFAGRLAGKVLPHFQLLNPIAAEKVSRDPNVIRSLKEDKLNHDTGTLEGLAGLLDRSVALASGRTRLNQGVKSLWVSHGTSDLLTSCSASQKWYGEQTGVEDKELKIYDGWYHQLHADLPENNHIFAKDVGDWILARSGAEEGRQVSGPKL